MLSEGSQWRRWDLHVHTPETALNNGFKDWEEYLCKVEASPEVVAIGVTDYLTISNYSRLKQFREAGRIPSVTLLIPNIEFRLAPPTDKATAVNLHILVSPEDLQHEEQVSNALARLDWHYNERRYSCIPQQLIALGKAFNPKQTDDRVALSTGVLQFKVDFTHFRDWYNKESWLKRNSLIAVSAGNDGLSGFRCDGAWAAHRDEITRFSQIIFSGRPGERDFWLGISSDEDRETMRRLGGPKPCVHGSDAHEIAKLFKPDGNRFCWVKADLTFEGLRQILYEPADRVYIGPSAPLFHDQSRTIKCVRILDSNQWFDDITIPLNSGLVSVIGQKGSGKSALAELIAYAAGSWQTDGSQSFLTRAESHIDGSTVRLTWADDSLSEVRLFDEQAEDKKIRYLSQKFVEHLCAEDNIGSELVHEIESVIFSALDPTDTLNASSFEELRALRTDSIRAEGERIRDEIGTLIREETDLREQVNKVGEKKERIKALTAERDGLIKQMPAATSPVEAKAQSDLQDKRTALASLQQTIATFKQKLLKLSDVRSRASVFQTQINSFHTELTKLLHAADVSPSDFVAFKPQFAAHWESILVKREDELRKLISASEGVAQNPPPGTVFALQAQIKALTDLETADKARQEKVKSIQTRLASIATEIGRLEAEIKQLEGPSTERLNAARKERLVSYERYFTNLIAEQKTLEELYASVSSSQKVGNEPDSKLEFSIRWEADLDKWLERGAALFDQRRTIPYGNMQGLEKAAKSILSPAWISGDPTKISTDHQKFLEEFKKPEPKIRNYIRSGVKTEDLLQWLYEVDHIHLSYGLKYNGVELEKLSPGTKGIVLLILYLGMDTADTRPLVVDQPDKNLDNESIYKLLTSYFKKAKARRQIILITHNPNLVVNADSEQVIVATCTRRPDNLPHISYASGSFENVAADGSGIRQQVCRILEGGTDAFLKRERRYSLDES
jgi:energy-coupling factor transporter ATP-binding protein EcfA2